MNKGKSAFIIQNSKIKMQNDILKFKISIKMFIH